MDQENCYNTKLYNYADGYQIRRYKRNVRILSEREKERRKADMLSRKAEEAERIKTLIESDNLTGEQFSLDDILNDVKLHSSSKERSIQVSLNRSVNSIYQLARANRWEYFFTLTFNPDIVDSTDYAVVTKKLSAWLNNIKTCYCPDLKYIFVPEFHSDGKKYHFHGLVSDIGSLKLTDSGYRTKKGSIIYNVSNYNLGFSTATEVADSAKACGYIVKYFTKELFCVTKGKKRYWASRNLSKPGVMTYMMSEREFDSVLMSSYNDERLAKQKTVDLYVQSASPDGKPFNKISYFEFNDNPVSDN